LHEARGRGAVGAATAAPTEPSCASPPCPQPQSGRGHYLIFPACLLPT
jgi:hypothetical protein